MLKINDAAIGETTRSIIRYAATLIFFIMAISDAIDGFYARRKKQVTKLGSFLDPTADKLLITSACLLLASRHSHVNGFLLPSTVVVLIIGKDLILSLGFLIVYFITSRFYIAPALIGKTATALQLSMVTGILIAPEVSDFFPGWIWVLRLLWWSAAITAVLTTLVYIRKGIRYIEQHEQNS
jgi:CDP-diacylglycerol--glycerol-3-phosphate 3-phosphatidyltransferase